MQAEPLSSPSVAQTMPDVRPMAGKVVLITGGTGGIGKATAIGPCRPRARFGITGRDLEPPMEGTKDPAGHRNRVPAFECGCVSSAGSVSAGCSCRKQAKQRSH